MPETSDLVIIGSGPAGLTAAIYTARGNLSTTVLAGARWGGQLMLTTAVENFPGFPDGIQGPQLMMAMRQQAERLGVKIVNRDVSEVDFSRQSASPFRLIADGQEYLARSVIIATGSVSRWLGVPGEQPLIGRGVSSCAPCDAPFFAGKKVVVVGGGDAALEEASVLSKFASEVTLIHRREEFRASMALQNRVLGDKKVRVIWNTQVLEILGKEKVERIRLTTSRSTRPEVEQNFAAVVELRQGKTNPPTPAGETAWEMPVDGVFVAVGHDPATKIFAGKLELDEKGYIKKASSLQLPTSNLQMMTSVEGVFVAGDVHDYHYRQAITAAGFGCQAALEAIHWLEEAKT